MVIHGCTRRNRCTRVNAVAAIADMRRMDRLAHVEIFLIAARNRFQTIMLKEVEGKWWTDQDLYTILFPKRGFRGADYPIQDV